MDIADRAQGREEEFQASALAAALIRSHETPHVENGVRLCLDCDEELGALRLTANPHAVRCTDCQKHHEWKQKNGRG